MTKKPTPIDVPNPDKDKNIEWGDELYDDGRIKSFSSLSTDYGGYPTSHDNCWTANREKLTEHNFIATTITKSHA